MRHNFKFPTNLSKSGEKCPRIYTEWNDTFDSFTADDKTTLMTMIMMTIIAINNDDNENNKNVDDP